MKKVKVHRYVCGKRPDYAPALSSDEESENEDFLEKRPSHAFEDTEDPTLHSRIREEDDPRLRRLKQLDQQEADTELRGERRRRVQEPEVLEGEAEISHERIRLEASDSEEEEELSDSEVERRREALRQRVLSKKGQEVEVLPNEDVRGELSSDESSEYEEYTDSEEETGPRLKPVFVRKKDRITVMEREKEAHKQKQAEAEAKKMAEERRRQTLRVMIKLKLLLYEQNKIIL